MTNREYSLVRVESEAHWSLYHTIRSQVLFLHQEGIAAPELIHLYFRVLRGARNALAAHREDSNGPQLFRRDAINPIRNQHGGVGHALIHGQDAVLAGCF